MSVSAAQAEAFFQEVLRTGQVWAIRDEGGFPAPRTPEGRAMPFWSARSRAVKLIENVDAYEGFEPVPLTLDEWRSRARLTAPRPIAGPLLVPATTPRRG